jgi:hypothetical protein
VSKIVLGWQLNRTPDDGDVHETIRQVAARYQPLFSDTIRSSGNWRQNQGLLHFDVEQKGDPGLHLDGDLIVCLTGKPTIIGDESVGSTAVGANALYERLHRSRDRLDRSFIHRINPPFTLCSFDKESQRLCVVHDGLGEDQFFISAGEQGVVFSNKCWPILRLLGVAPRADHSAWKYWFCMGWFPGNSTPFENLHYLERGAVVSGDSRSVTVDAEDTFSSWIGPAEHGPATQRMDRALRSFREVIRLHRPGEAPYSADLTGGLDSRAICSVLINDGIPCRYVTGGNSFSADVIVAGKIARRFRLDWSHVPPRPFGRRTDLAKLVDTQFRKMLLWGEGLVEPNRFRHFGVEKSATEHGTDLSGGSAEISKGHYYGQRLRADTQSPFDYAEFLSRFEREAATLLADGDPFDLTGLIRHQASAGEAYGVSGFSLLDYFYLSERTRRWQSAHLAINLFDLSVLPFINIEHIKLAFAMQPGDKAAHRFQEFIIAQNTAALLRVPKNTELYRNPLYWLSRAASRVAWLGRLMNQSDWPDYFRGHGRSVIENVLSSEAPLWQILDRDKSTKRWHAFLRGTNSHLHALLQMVSFSFWHSTFVERAPLDPLS